MVFFFFVTDGGIECFIPGIFLMIDICEKDSIFIRLRHLKI
jgi:hypothetical protein